MGKSKNKGFIELDFEDTAIQEALATARSGVRPRARGAMDRSGKRLRADMRTRLAKGKRIDTRRLYNAVAYEVTESGDNVTLRVGPRVGDPEVEPYDVVVDQGRKAGKPAPPTGVLIPWMTRHGIPKRAEFPIRMKIGKEGTTAVPYLDLSAERSKIVPEEIDDVLTFVTKTLG